MDARIDPSSTTDPTERRGEPKRETGRRFHAKPSGSIACGLRSANQPPLPMAERLVPIIEDDIVEGRLPPGTRLDEVGLAARHGMSRTPVREALRRLGQTGLVEIRPRRGAVVVRPEPHAVVEMFEVMAELEAYAGRLAARRARTDEIEALVRIHQDCMGAEADGNTDAYYAANERFHRLIYTASGNGFLADEAGRMHSRLKPYRRLQLRAPRRLGASLREHQTVLDALRVGNGDATATALRAHVAVQGERFGDLLRAMEATAAPPLRASGSKR